MELPDAALADWLTGRQPIPEDVDTPMLRAIRDAAGEASPR
jgi:antitoxin CptB